MVVIVEILKLDREKLKEFLMIVILFEYRIELFFNYGKLKFINDFKVINVDFIKFVI